MVKFLIWAILVTFLSVQEWRTYQNAKVEHEDRAARLSALRTTPLSEIAVDQKIILEGTLRGELGPISRLTGKPCLVHQIKVSQVVISRETRYGSVSKIRDVVETRSLKRLHLQTEWGPKVVLETSDGQVELDTALLRLVAKDENDLPASEANRLREELKLRTQPRVAEVEASEALLSPGQPVLMTGWVRSWDRSHLKLEGEVGSGKLAARKQTRPFPQSFVEFVVTRPPLHRVLIAVVAALWLRKVGRSPKKLSE